MTHKSANSNSINDSPRLALTPQQRGKGVPRCTHLTPTGRQCRLPVPDAQSPFCFRHTQLRHQHFQLADLSPDLVGQLTDFKSAADINQVLSKLLILLSQNRVSPRRAAVIAYVTSLLLRTLPAIEHEADEQTVVVWDIPRPDRSQPVEAGEPVPQTP